MLTRQFIFVLPICFAFGLLMIIVFYKKEYELLGQIERHVTLGLDYREFNNDFQLVEVCHHVSTYDAVLNS